MIAEAKVTFAMLTEVAKSPLVILNMLKDDIEFAARQDQSILTN
jgi:hypothetical protein